MSKRKSARNEVQRLHEIVVEEVSLVDHAANKHRFLIVKRSDEMDENHDSHPDQVADEQGEDQDIPNDSATVPEDLAAGDEALPLAVAAEVLTSLTDAVELLQTQQGGEQARVQLAALATELHGLSEQLAEAIGSEPAPTTSPEPPTPTTDADKAADATNSSTGLTTAMGALRDALAELRQALPAKPRAGNSAPSRTPSEGQPARSTRTTTDLRDQLSTLTHELRTLNTSVKDQHKRLARLEKSYGLPNSQPAGERQRPRHDDDEDVGWPLDLNTAFDRESVDKAISFHDV